MAAADTWRIRHESGDPNGEKLNGCIINRTAIQTELLAPDLTPVAPPQNSVDPPITFDKFSLLDAPGIEFSLTIHTFEHGILMDEAHGSWSSKGPDNVPEDGHWTGQAGGGVEAKAESASAADTSY
ncbi:MAG TPA: hypothetical protein VFH31_16980 [Pyrinomonadaceae bacterium]|nr:hypothetical protein [Pyrinomonadaceae bacterium]